MSARAAPRLLRWRRRKLGLQRPRPKKRWIIWAHLHACTMHALTLTGPSDGQAYKVIHGDMEQGASVKVLSRA